MRQAALDARHRASERFAMVVKSYLPDLAYVERLLQSFHAHNADEIPLFLVVPDDALDAFIGLAAPLVTLIGESAFSDHLIQEPLNGYHPGYINQEIVKLAFWETGLADNYLCVDSDAEFVRDFHRFDFMADESTPYTFLTEDAELRAQPEYYQTYWRDREPVLRRIQNEVGLDEPRLLTVHGHAVFSSTVLGAFVERFLSPRGWDYVDALSIAPLEPSWYSMWLQKDQTIPIIMREPIVKTFHNAQQQLEYAASGLTNDDVAYGYVAVVVNSNYSRGASLASLSDSAAEVVAATYRPKEVATASFQRLTRSTSRWIRGAR